MKRFPLLPSFLLLLLAATGLPGCDHPANGDSATPDPVILEKLEQIVSVREAAWQNQQLREQAGLAEPDLALVTALVEARVALAEERGEPETIVAELQFLVATLKAHVERAEALVQESRRTQEEVQAAQAELLEAEIRLLRAQAALPGG